MDNYFFLFILAIGIEIVTTVKMYNSPESNSVNPDNKHYGVGAPNSVDPDDPDRALGNGSSKKRKRKSEDSRGSGNEGYLIVINY